MIAQLASWFSRYRTRICQHSVAPRTTLYRDQIVLHDSAVQCCPTLPRQCRTLVPRPGPMQDTALLEEGASQPNALQRYRQRQKVRGKRFGCVTRAVRAMCGTLHCWPMVSMRGSMPTTHASHNASQDSDTDGSGHGATAATSHAAAPVCAHGPDALTMFICTH
jgi:hypothetical protein